MKDALTKLAEAVAHAATEHYEPELVLEKMAELSDLFDALAASAPELTAKKWLDTMAVKLDNEAAKLELEVENGTLFDLS